MRIFGFLLVLTSICFVYSIPQHDPESNQPKVPQTTNQTETTDTYKETNPVTDDNIFIPDIPINDNDTALLIKLDSAKINDTAIQITTKLETPSFATKFYIAIKTPIIKFIETPKVNVVLKNIGTCMVNGAMEIISYYFPAPLMPLIASAAGMIIPFEPIVMLRKRMPVTNYRRAFNKAVNSFMGTFNRFKTSEEDPYMTRRFNRRFMQDSGQDKNLSKE